MLRKGFDRIESENFGSHNESKKFFAHLKSGFSALFSIHCNQFYLSFSAVNSAKTDKKCMAIEKGLNLMSGLQTRSDSCDEQTLKNKFLCLISWIGRWVRSRTQFNLHHQPKRFIQFLCHSMPHNGYRLWINGLIYLNKLLVKLIFIFYFIRSAGFCQKWENV